MRPNIFWEHWKNPYGEADCEFTPESDGDDNNENNEESTVLRAVVPTPMGFLPVQPWRNFYEVFEFWIGHCNFYITKKVKKIIEFTPGVEIIDVFSPYRFRICIGKAFDGKQVKSDIQQRVLESVSTVKEINLAGIVIDDHTKKAIDELQKEIDQSFTYWAIYLFPNGNVDYIGSNKEQEYRTKFDVYSQAMGTVGGVIYHNA